MKISQNKVKNIRKNFKPVVHNLSHGFDVILQKEELVECRNILYPLISAKLKTKVKRITEADLHFRTKMRKCLVSE